MFHDYHISSNRSLVSNKHFPSYPFITDSDEEDTSQEFQLIDHSDEEEFH